MYSQRAFLLIVAVAFALVVSGVQAADSLPVAQLKTTVRDSSGTLTLVVSGAAPENNNWLGVSLYKPYYTDAIWDAQHSAYQMPRGDFTKAFTVPKELEGGIFEVALWKNKVAQKTIYRMETMRGYGGGSKDSAHTYPASDSISALKTVIEAKAGKTSLKITGSAPDKEDWLGISFYKASYADPVLDADYSVRRVTHGDFALTIRVPEGFETGTYDTALWKNQVERREIYKFTTMLGYGTGYTVKE